ncbi:MAG: gamma-glutamylcyclotransferase [Deltaproteobacteria bacterium]|nr:gamma-glutamylcyclotransferase [Deltaproteobacteria bacterium]
MEAEQLLFAYGSLRRGQPYHHLLGNSPFVRLTHSVAQYTLSDLGEYPALSCGGDTAITGELYRVTEQTLLSLDRYEGREYHRQQIDLQDGTTAVGYVCELPQAPRIASGDWVDHLNKR